jgi:hypothetical protein
MYLYKERATLSNCYGHKPQEIEGFGQVRVSNKVGGKYEQ